MKKTYAAGLALVLAGCGGGDDQPRTSPPDIRGAIGRCDDAVGRMGSRLASLDRGGNPVEAVKASRDAAGACRGAAVQIDAGREVLSEPVHAACTAAGELGETLAETVREAIETPANPSKLATMERAAESYRAMRGECLAQNLP